MAFADFKSVQLQRIGTKRDWVAQPRFFWSSLCQLVGVLDRSYPFFATSVLARFIKCFGIIPSRVIHSLGYSHSSCLCFSVMVSEDLSHVLT